MAANASKVTTNRNRTSPQSGRYQTSRHSHISWVSTLGFASPTSGAPPAIPPTIHVTMPTISPASSSKSIKDDPADHPSLHDSALGLHDTGFKRHMDEEAAIGAPHAGTGDRAKRSRSIVESLVHSFRMSRLPRAVTHNQLRDRQPMEVCSSVRSSSVCPNPATCKYAHPVPLLPYPMFANGVPAYEHSQGHTSEWCSSKEGYSDDSWTSRIGGFLVELSSLPWVSSRVAVDYVPGEGRGIAPKKMSRSWYTPAMESTTSTIPNKEMIPTPWFPPLQPTEEVTEPPEHIETQAAPDGESVEQKLRRLQEELQAKTDELQSVTMELNTVQRVVDYQKERIANLEEELKQVKEELAEKDVPAEVHRRRSSTRKSLYQARNSMRAVSMRRGSRPGSRAGSIPAL